MRGGVSGIVFVLLESLGVDGRNEAGAGDSSGANGRAFQK